MLNFIMTSTGISFISKNVPHVVNKTHSNFYLVRDAINEDDEEALERLLDVSTAVSNFMDIEEHSLVQVIDGVVFYDGEEVNDVIAVRIREMMSEGFDSKPIMRFLENLMSNPSFNSREQLYSFIEHDHLPITNDGCFLAYKTVTSEFWSKTSGSLTLLQGTTNSQGQIYNAVGEVIECDRSQVDDNPNNNCSKGLHVGAWEYSGKGGWFNNGNENVVIVKVNPRDAVSVPTDHEAQKLRVCRYEVVSCSEGELNDTVVSAETPYKSNIQRFSREEQVEFTYPDEKGIYEYRHGFVEKDSWSDDTHVTMLLGEEDVSFVSRVDPEYRQFDKSLMDEVDFV